MAKIRVLFYKAKFGDKKWLDDAISAWTGIWNWGTGSYSHVELEDVQTNKMYTSTMRGDTKGVVKRPASETLKHPERWDYIDIEIGEHYKYMIKFAEDILFHKPKYSFKTALSFFLPWRINPKKEYICSELVYLLLFVGGVFKGSYEDSQKCPSPRRLSRWLTKRGYEINPLKEKL